MRYRVAGAVFSIVLVLVSLVAIAVNGINYALDFTGGTQVTMVYEMPPDLDAVRQALTDNGYPEHEVSMLGQDTVQINIQGADNREDAQNESGATADAVSRILTDAGNGQATFGGSTFIGAQVGDELKEKGGIGMLVAAVMLMGYIAARFQFKFSVGAVLSVVHDVIITLGFLAAT
ncbi:MAG: preprotein translocase subunit SecF, partial [Gammaproteobacteria bacterium]